MIKEQIQELEDMDLIDELHRTQEVLNLVVAGMLNTDHQADPIGLFWVKEDLRLITQELEARLVKNQK